MTPGASLPPGGGADRTAAVLRSGVSQRPLRGVPARVPPGDPDRDRSASRPQLGRRASTESGVPPRRRCLGRPLREAREDAHGDPPRRRTGSPRPRGIAVGAAVADRRSRRLARVGVRRRAGDLDRPFVRRTPGAGACGPEPAGGRAARPPRPRDRDPTARGALGGGERATAPPVLELLRGDRPALRRESAAGRATGARGGRVARTPPGGRERVALPLRAGRGRRCPLGARDTGAGVHRRPGADARRGRRGLVPPLRPARRARIAQRWATCSRSRRCPAGTPSSGTRWTRRRLPSAASSTPSLRSARRRARGRRRGSRCPPLPPPA